nr:tetratricopeptide repeat protein [Denitromonas sp.]
MSISQSVDRERRFGGVARLYGGAALARLLQARCEAELGNFDAAIRQLQNLVAEDPRNIDAWYSLGKF